MPPASFEGGSFPYPRLGWGLFIILLLGTISVALGEPLSVAFLILTLAAVLIALRFPYFGYYLFVATALLLGWFVVISTGSFQFGDYVFGGSVNINMAELIAGAVLVAWAVRMLLLWRGRRDWNWRPWLPFFGYFLLIVAAHFASAFSPVQPDVFPVIKFSLRPVLFAYLSSVALTVNFVRSQRRLVATLSILTLVGLFFAGVGFVSLFVFQGGLFSLHRARPLDLFGVNLLGGNHNSMAEVLLFTIPASLALGALSRSPRFKAFTGVAAIFMLGVALLTFARSAWIALAVQLALLLSTVWRPWLARHRDIFFLVLLALSPLMVYMVRFSFTPVVQGSTDARALVTAIAFDQFRDSPFVGVGAGTFVDRLSQVYAYVVEFGGAIDAHGVLQKLASETGVLGLIAFAAFFYALFRYAFHLWRIMKPLTPEMRAYAYLLAAMTGAFVYQFFDVTYWTPRFWLPIGLFLAGSRILVTRQKERDPNFLAGYE